MLTRPPWPSRRLSPQRVLLALLALSPLLLAWPLVVPHAAQALGLGRGGGGAAAAAAAAAHGAPAAAAAQGGGGAGGAGGGAAGGAAGGPGAPLPSDLLARLSGVYGGGGGGHGAASQVTMGRGYGG